MYLSALVICVAAVCALFAWRFGLHGCGHTGCMELTMVTATIWRVEDDDEDAVMSLWRLENGGAANVRNAPR